MQLKGIVTSAADGTPIAQAEILLGGRSGSIGKFYTDAAGTFHVLDASGELVGKTLHLEASKAGFQPTSLQRTISAADDVALEIELAPITDRAVTVRGSVQNAKTQAPVAQADVTCTVQGTVIGRTQTDQQGAFTFTDTTGQIRDPAVIFAASRQGFKSEKVVHQAGAGGDFAQIDLLPEGRELKLWWVLAGLALVVASGIGFTECAGKPSCASNFKREGGRCVPRCGPNERYEDGRCIDKCDRGHSGRATSRTAAA